MYVHIIGVATTFMSGLAVLAKQEGHHVTCSDNYISHAIRLILEAEDIRFNENYSPYNLEYAPDLVILGNDIFADNEELIEAEKRSIPYILGSVWLEEYVLHNKWRINNSVENISEEIVDVVQSIPENHHEEKLRQLEELKTSLHKGIPPRAILSRENTHKENTHKELVLKETSSKPIKHAPRPAPETTGKPKRSIH